MSISACLPFALEPRSRVASRAGLIYPEGMQSNDPRTLIRIAREAGVDTAVEPLNLGERVRGLRRSRGWTLEEAASKIENGQMSPTYEALKKLAGGLAISVPQLFTPPSRVQVNGRMAVTKTGEGQLQATTTYEHQLLAACLTRKAMLPYQARIRARTLDEFDGWVRHDGEEFLYVLTGVIRLYSEFYEPVELRRGDSAYYDAAMGHNVISLSEEDATILWVTSLT